LPYWAEREVIATIWVGGVRDRDLNGLFLFVLAVAHSPRVVNEAFNDHAVGQLELDQLSQDFELGQASRPRKEYDFERRTFMSQSAAKNPPSTPLKGSTFIPRSSSQNTVLSELFE
jgi:hypothetical protein